MGQPLPQPMSRISEPRGSDATASSASGTPMDRLRSPRYQSAMRSYSCTRQYILGAGTLCSFHDGVLYSAPHVDGRKPDELTEHEQHRDDQQELPHGEILHSGTARTRSFSFLYFWTRVHLALE